MELNDFGYLDTIKANLERVKKEQAENIRKAAELMADAVANDKLISVYGGGGHTNAGTCQLDNDIVDAELPNIIAKLNEHN